jgi:hypothetical protein
MIERRPNNELYNGVARGLMHAAGHLAARLSVTAFGGECARRNVLTISRRLGHGSPTITLGVYGHLFTDADDRAGQIIEAAFAGTKTE